MATFSPSKLYENHQLILDHIDSHMSQDIEDHIPQFYKKSSISSTSSPEPPSSHYHHQHHIYRPAIPQQHQQFRVIKDGRQMYEDSGYQVSSSENFKTEHQHQMAPPTSTVVAVSNAHSSGSVGSSGGHKMKIISNEEPSSSMPDLEFDGTNVLCRVCGDKASGFHYGVHSCEGCKGFFRRSIQQKIQYRPCTKNQQCMIQRVNRNRCQYCRLKKCIAVGMSRDAVRFGRVPKREKARIEAAMQQQTRNRALTTHVWTDGIEDVQSIIDTVVGAHMETCEFTRERVREMKLRAKDCPNYTEPTRACPLNPAPEIQSEQEFSQRFADVIRGVIEFAGKIPGFELLAQGDKFTLLKAGLFDALFVRLIGMFDTSLDSIVCLNGQLMRRDSIQNGANARFLVDSTFKFAERINAMQLNDAEVALFCAVVLIAPDRHGIRNYELIQRMHAKLKQCLQHVIVKGRPNEPEFMGNLMNTIGDLKTLSTLHTEKLVVFRNEMNQQMSNGLEQQIQVTDVSTLQKPLTQQQTLNSTTSPPLNGHHYQQSPSPHHQPQIRMCPRIMDAQSSDGSMSTITSSEPSPPPPQMQMCPAKQSPILLAKLQGCPMGYQAQQQQQRKIIQHRSSTESPTSQQQLSHPNIPAGTTITAVTRPMTQGGQTTVVQTVTRKLDSPTDSGIESGSDGGCINGSKIGSGSSSCSSPRSSLEDVPVMTQSLAESLPTLKRALEKPAIFDPNMYHKKFRRCPQGSDGGSPPIMIHHNEPSQLQTILTAPRNNGHLAMTHSNLVDRLKMAPKMSEEHRKNQELLNRFIDQGGVIKSTAKVHISAAPMVDSMEGAPLNLSKKTAQTTTIVIGNGGSVSVNGDADTKIMVEA